MSIQEWLDLKINPALKVHTGNASVTRVVDKVVTIKLTGGCAGCPSSQITMFNTIEPLLKEQFPEIKEVILG